MFKDYLIKIRNIEIRIRKAVNSQMHGNFKSVFKGAGIEFADLREYQYGDDVRLIDWNVSSKGHGTFVKIFHEEKQQSVFFLVDVSGSQQVGQANNTKLAATKEICGALAVSAIQEASKVGLLCFSDQNEKYIRPAEGIKQGYLLLNELFKLRPESTKTNISDAILFTLKVLKKRSVVILISDFLDSGYDQNLKAIARKHDLVLLHIRDKRETDLPQLGIVPTFDPETKRMRWLNTSSFWFRSTVQAQFAEVGQKLEQFSRLHNANYITLNSQEDFVPPLIRLFKIRRKGQS